MAISSVGGSMGSALSDMGGAPEAPEPPSSPSEGSGVAGSDAPGGGASDSARGPVGGVASAMGGGRAEGGRIDEASRSERSERSEEDMLAETGRIVGDGGLVYRGTGDLAAVREIQRALNRAGAQLEVDGYFGPRTDAAVRAFQQAVGAKVDGLVGPETLGAMRGQRPGTDAYARGGMANPQVGLRFGVGAPELPGRNPMRGGPLAPNGAATPPPPTRAPDGAVAPAEAPPLPTQNPVRPDGAPSATEPHRLQDRAIRSAFMRRLVGHAIESERRTGVPAEVTLAQAALESGWGKSGLAARHNNYFGIKSHGKPGSAGTVRMPTTEYRGGRRVREMATFRKYRSPADSFTDHGRFLRENRRYRNAFQYANDPARFARELQRAGYATDPAYAQKLVSIMRRTGLM